jgi:ketosteroid isomerase-like protein
MATNAERAAVLVRALEAAIVDDTAAIPELSTEDVEGWAPALSVASADDVVIDPTGLRVSLHGVAVAEFDGDRIASFRQYWDQGELLDQLPPAPWE